MTVNKQENLRKVYHDPSEPGSFSSKRNLLANVQEKDARITKDDVNAFARNDIVFSLHAPARRRFPRNPYRVPHPNHTAQVDLVDMQAFEKENDGFKYIMTLIDVFSKKAYVFPLKTKTGKEIANCFKDLFSHYVPANMQSDRGTEFTNKEVQKIMQDHRVNFYFSLNSDIKCGVVERFNRTLKGRMFKYFSSRGTRKYIDVLPLLVNGYNKSYHRTIKMRPIDVTSSNTAEVFSNTYGHIKRFPTVSENKPKFKIGDSVRVKYELKPMDKSYYPNWSDAVYTIKVVIRGLKRIMYRLMDEQGKELPRRFYQEEVQKVDKNTAFRIEVVRRDKKNKRVLVKWLNHPGMPPSWIPEKDLL